MLAKWGLMRIMPGHGRRRRKRNRSTPTQSKPNKKSKSLNNSFESEQSGGEQSGGERSDQSGVWLDIVSDTDSVSGSGSSNVTKASNVPIPNDSTSVLCGDISSAPSPTSDSFNSAGTAIISPITSAVNSVDLVINSSTMNQGFSQSNVIQDAGMMNPMSTADLQASQSILSGANVNGSFYGPPPMPGYQQSFSQPGTPGMPGIQPTQFAISDSDVMRIAASVKSLLHDEITKIVKLKVQQETHHLNSRIADLQKENAELKSTVSGLTTKMDELEQYSRRSCVRISGVKEEKDENVNVVVGRLIDRLNLDVKPDDIDRLHRVGRTDRVTADGRPTGPRDIIVKLCTSNARLQLLKGRKPLRDNNESIFISEDLTATRMALAFKCREHVRDKKSNVSKTWTFNGNVFVKDKAGKVFKIAEEHDLDYFKKKSNASSEEAATGGSPMAS